MFVVIRHTDEKHGRLLHGLGHCLEGGPTHVVDVHPDVKPSLPQPLLHLQRAARGNDYNEPPSREDNYLQIFLHMQISLKRTGNGGGGGENLFTFPYPLKVQARLPWDQRPALQSRVSEQEEKEWWGNFEFWERPKHLKIEGTGNWHLTIFIFYEHQEKISNKNYQQGEITIVLFNYNITLNIFSPQVFFIIC